MRTSDRQSSAAGDGIERLVDAVKPLEIERPSDDRARRSLQGYIWRMGGRHQIGAALLAIMVAVLDPVPMELQRRIVDDALTSREFEPLIFYGSISRRHHPASGAEVLLQMYQGWLSESAILYTRRYLTGFYGQRLDKGDERDSGSSVSTLDRNPAA